MGTGEREIKDIALRKVAEKKKNHIRSLVVTEEQEGELDGCLEVKAFSSLKTIKIWL